jgi:transketolase C-terminal domain/subunit
MGVKDTFGKSGTARELLEHFKLTEKDIIEEVKR